MGLFSRKPTAAEVKQINSLLGRMGTCCRRLESVDSIDRYFTEWDKYLSEYQQLDYYAKQGIKFSVSPQKIHLQICKEIPRIEKDVLRRAYDRMLRNAAKVTTEKAKQKKADAFFNEIEYYHSRLQPDTISLANTLKERTRFTSQTSAQSPKASVSANRTQGRYCTHCGAQLDQDAAFCGKCGNKV